MKRGDSITGTTFSPLMNCSTLVMLWPLPREWYKKRLNSRSTFLKSIVSGVTSAAR